MKRRRVGIEVSAWTARRYMAMEVCWFWQFILEKDGLFVRRELVINGIDRIGGSQTRCRALVWSPRLRMLDWGNWRRAMDRRTKTFPSGDEPYSVIDAGWMIRRESSTASSLRVH